MKVRPSLAAERHAQALVAGANLVLAELSVGRFSVLQLLKEQMATREVKGLV